MADKIIENNQVSLWADRYRVYFQPSGLWRRFLHDGYSGKTSQRFGGQDPGDGV